MKNQQREIGLRLKEIRSIFNSGYKCTIEQFAEVLNESKHNLSNYENGKASIPNRTLNALYFAGINPNYILTGEGDKFAPNEEGKALKERCLKNKGKDELEFFNSEELINLDNDELLKIAEKYQSAAGDIIKILANRKGAK